MQLITSLQGETVFFVSKHIYRKWQEMMLNLFAISSPQMQALHGSYVLYCVFVTINLQVVHCGTFTAGEEKTDQPQRFAGDCSMLLKNVSLKEYALMIAHTT